MCTTATPRHGSREPEWFASWFDSPHYQSLYAHRDEAEAAAFIDLLIERLGFGSGSSVLDLGCGNGRHSRRLASHGYRVTGIDLSADSLALAREQSAAPVEWVRQDMRRAFGTDAFDYILSLFTSFGYFADPADHFTVVDNIGKALRPGGSLVLDYLNTQVAEKHLVRDEVIERHGTTFRISRWADRDAICKRIVIDGRAGTAREFIERVAKFAVDDFRLLFALCGLTVQATFGDYQFGPFDAAGSPRLIVVATKAAIDGP